MLRRKENRQGVGKAIRAPMLNALQKGIETIGRLRALPPIGITQTPGGSVIYWSGPQPDVQLFLPTGTIPAATGTAPNNVTPGKGQGTQYYRDKNSGILTAVGTDAVDIYNWAFVAVGSTSGYVPCALINGDWIVLNDACTST